jgi:nucleotide-binding universal stress UspA family protein
MPGFDHLVVALGCAEGDANLIAYASMLATLGEAKEVRFVHVAESSASAAAIREQMRNKVLALFSGKAWTQCDVLNGPLTDRLLAYVTEYQADLILMGSKKHKLGARLAMVAPCSVAVIPSDYAARLTHMLIAIDFSDAAGDTLQWATSLAAGDRSIRCTALHVMTRESVDLFAENETEPEQAQAMRKILARADRNGVTVVPRLAGATHVSEIGRRNLLSLPSAIQGAAVAETILDTAAECGADCIALATRGRSASASILLGSVTEKVIERATTPLLVGKHFGASLGLTEILLGRAGWRSAFKTN